MTVITERARAYVYAGDWVADCPRGCGNTEHLFERTSPNGPRCLRVGSYVCSYCKHLAPVEWPDSIEEIMSVLSLRPVPLNRNWYPSGHDVAIRFRIPHGQSVTDLVEENAEHGISR